MTDERFHEIDDQLQGLGWRYNLDAEEFETGDGSWLDWHDILAYLPDVTMNELDSFADRKQREHRAG